MPNPYHFRARIDRLWRTANSSRPGYIRLNALDAVARELYRPTDKARQNLKMYLATDPFEVAEHKLRHLHDQPSLLPPLPLGEGRGEGAPASLKVAPAKAGARPEEDEPPNEDDDPL